MSSDLLLVTLLRLRDVGGAQRRRQRGARWVSDAEDPRPLDLVSTGHRREAVPPRWHFLFAVGLHTENSPGEEKDTAMLRDLHREKCSEYTLANKQRSLCLEKTEGKNALTGDQ